MSTSAILLSGGFGKRFGSPLAKQYHCILGKPIILHSLEALLQVSDWQQIVVVCEEKHEELFAPYSHLPLLFARPGNERQDSVFSGLCQLSPDTRWVCIHDGARPLLQKKDLKNVLEEGKRWGAAALAVPVPSTIKRASSDLLVKETLDRKALFTLQTPQVIAYSLLMEGHLRAQKEHLLCTDDISLVEYLSHVAKLVIGSESNLKITTPTDLLLAELLCQHTK